MYQTRSWQAVRQFHVLLSGRHCRDVKLLWAQHQKDLPVRVLTAGLVSQLMQWNFLKSAEVANLFQPHITSN